MKYELDTIPVLKAFEDNTECALCRLFKLAEQRYTDFFLGNSVMVPDMRVQVNKSGFCMKHYSQLLDSRKNRHGLGLLSHTHLQEQNKQLLKQHKTIHKLIASKGWKKKEKINAALKSYREKLYDLQCSCLICERLEETMTRYLYTIIYLWLHEESFHDLLKSSCGFCVPHTYDLLTMTESKLSGHKLELFLQDVFAVQEKNLIRLEEEVLWYTQKFDYQNDNKPWGTSRDALHRTIQKLTGVEQKEG